MEPAIRGARIEPAIVAARLATFSSQAAIIFGLPNGVGPPRPAPGNGIFRCRDGTPESAVETTSVARDRRSGTILTEIPTETACFRSTRKPAVWLDWMVGLVWTELPTPHAVIEPVSDPGARNGIFQCRDGRVKDGISARRDRSETKGTAKKPAFRGANGQMSGEVRYLKTGWWARQGSNL
jgi:hypothetical protein